MAKTDFLSHILIMGSKVYPGLALVCPGLQPPMLPNLITNVIILESSKRLFDEAMKAGFVGVTIIVCVVLGPPGVGKTCIKYLLLDQ